MRSISLSMPTSNSISIQRVRDLHQVHSFLQNARISMFADRVNAQETPADLLRFEASYQSGCGCMLAALDSQQNVQATIACRDYDGRFAQLNFKQHKVVEVVRLFVAPEYRRAGLAGMMLDRLRSHAKLQNVDLLYLHTHPFLPGALEFWQKHGFDVIKRDCDPTWQTIHLKGRAGTTCG